MRKQKGTTLVELMLTVSLMGFIAVSLFAKTNVETEVVLAKKLGVDVQRYNTAVQSYITANPNASYPIERTGSAWLKHTSCTGGLSSQSYLPCDFPDFVVHNSRRFGHLTFTTTINKSTIGGETYIQAETHTTPIHHQDVQRPDLAGVSAIIAASGNTSIHSPEPMVTTSSYGSSPQTAQITMRASNAPSQDAWLRTNGSNNMRANLVFDTTNPANQRQIQGASVIKGMGSETMTLKPSESANTSIEIEPNKVTSKSGTTLFEVSPTRAVTTAGTASVDVSSGNVTSKVGNSSSEVTSSRVTNRVGSNASSEITSTSVVNRVDSTSVEVNASHSTTRGDHQIRGITSIGQDRNVDFNAVRYAAAPLNKLRLAMDGHVVLTGNLNVNNHSADDSGHILLSDDISAGSFRSRYIFANDNNPSDLWRVDLSGDSVLNTVWLQGDVTLNSTGTPNTRCYNNGELAKTGSGDLIWCQSGYWQQAASHD